MLAKQYRLPQTVSFQNAKVFTTTFLRVLVQKNALSQNRFGFVISKKIDKRAVARNRMRRLLSHLAVEFSETGSGQDVLIFVKQSFFKGKSEEALNSAKELLQKLL